MTALALRPREIVLEFRRCTGHCCRNVAINVSPGDMRRRFLDERIWEPLLDQALLELLRYMGWTPERGHRYTCRALLPNGNCAVHGTKWKPAVCREHPHYGRGPWERCDHKGCTRRVLVVGGRYPLRWRFPDLWELDQYMHNRTSPPEALAAPEVGLEYWEE